MGMYMRLMLLVIGLTHATTPAKKSKQLKMGEPEYFADAPKPKAKKLPPVHHTLTKAQKLALLQPVKEYFEDANQSKKGKKSKADEVLEGSMFLLEVSSEVVVEPDNLVTAEIAPDMDAVKSHLEKGERLVGIQTVDLPTKTATKPVKTYDATQVAAPPAHHGASLVAQAPQMQRPQMQGASLIETSSEAMPIAPWFTPAVAMAQQTPIMSVAQPGGGALQGANLVGGVSLVQGPPPVPLNLPLVPYIPPGNQPAAVGTGPPAFLQHRAKAKAAPKAAPKAPAAPVKK